MWKLGVLGLIASVISVGLIVGGSREDIVSAVGADVVSKASGNWSSPSTWSSGSAPQPGQSVEIAAGHRVIFDSNLSNAGIGKLDIFGTLEFSREAHTVLESRGNVIVRDGGELIAGTESDPLHHAVSAAIVFDVADNSRFVGGAFFEESDTGLWVFNGGRWESHGAPIERPWTKLAAPVEAGSRTVIAKGDLSDWYVGGDVLITATGRNYSHAIGTTGFFTEDEERKIEAINPRGDGTTEILLDSPVKYTHAGSIDPDALRGEIALLTRNVRVASKTGERAHTLFMWGAFGAPTFTQFKKLGPRDVFGRYPLHFHLMAESSVGRKVRGNVIWDSENRFIVVHNSLGMILEENIGYRGLRSGFWLEESSAGKLGPRPKTNTLIRNLAVKVTSLDSSDRRPAAIHAQRENHYIDNVVVSMNGSTDASGFAWQENEIASTGTAFVGNETHSSYANGVFGWQNHGKYHIVDFTGWRNNIGAKWGAYSNSVQFHGNTLVGNSSSNFRSRNNKPFIQDSYLAGEDAYPTTDGLFIDFYTLPPSPSKPAKTIRNVFENHSKFDINHLSKSTCGSSSSDCIPTFNAVIDTELRSPNNIRFGNSWEATDVFFDVANYDGTVDGLPENFRLTRPDQSKPSSKAFFSSEFDAWVDPGHAQPAKWASPPTIQWNTEFSKTDLASGPVTFSATAQGFTGSRGEIEFFVDEFKDGNPWVAEYFPNPDLSGAPVATLNQMEIDFTWGLENPGFVKNRDASALIGMLPDASWSVRLTRTLRSEGGTYEFKYRANDGFRLYIDGQRVVSRWGVVSACCTFEGTERVDLPAGDHTVKVEFFHKSSDGAKLALDIYRVLAGSSDTESFTFDARDWDRKYAAVYARAHDPATGMFAYTPVQRFRNPWFSESGSTSPDSPPVVVPTATVSAPTPTPVVVPTEADPEPITAPAGDRTSNGLIVLYEFDEAAGATVTDTSGFRTPLNLAVQDSSRVSWLPGALSIDSGTLISSASSAGKIADAVGASGEITVEAWIRPENLTQSGPARIVSISADPWNRNLTFGQLKQAFDVRLRTTGTSLNGTPSTATDSDTVSTELTHVVYTRSASGETTVYVDGVVVAADTVKGDLSNWADGYRLAIGNEFSGDRPWLGELYLVALFDRALSASEIKQNFGAGSEIDDGTHSAPSEPEPTPSPTSTPEPTATPVPTTTPVPTATPEPTTTPIPSPTPTPEPTSTPTPEPVRVEVLHIADIDGSVQKFRNLWTAHLLIAVTDQKGNPVSGAVVLGAWNGAAGNASCTTGATGVCLIATDGIPMKVGAIAWQVADLVHPELDYDSGSNADPDGDSTGSSITVFKP